MLTQLRDVVSRKQAVEECDLPAQLVRQYPRVATWIRRCLSYKPCDRPSVSEILADPVFSAGFWTPAVMGRVGAASDAVMDASIAMCITSNGSVASVGSNGGGSDRIHALEAKVAEQETIIAQLREQLLAMQRVQSTP
jgi:serine/threonine protein kinase